MEFLLDSVVLIDRFNAVPEAKRYLAGIRGKAAISVVTRAEALVGFGASSRAMAVKFLDLFPLLEITKPVADLAASTAGSCPTPSRPHLLDTTTSSW